MRARKINILYWIRLSFTIINDGIDYKIVDRKFCLLTSLMSSETRQTEFNILKEAANKIDYKSLKAEKVQT